MKGETVPEERIGIPARYLTELVRGTEDLSELKVALSVLLISSARQMPAVPLEELFTPTVVHGIVTSTSPRPADERLKLAIDRAVANGRLLRLTVREGDGVRTYLVPASAGNRKLVERLRSNAPEAARAIGIPQEGEAVVYRPNMFAFYEQHIGPLTPLVAESLREVERSYPRSWIEDAIREAEQYNKRNWRYVEAILAGWERTGGPDGISGQRP